jgi:hypothetical protein
MQTEKTEIKLQYEEDIEQGEWVEIGDFFNSKKKVYGNILDVLNLHNQA